MRVRGTRVLESVELKAIERRGRTGNNNRRRRFPSGMTNKEDQE
jgi:hypothetical protein